VPIKHRSAVKIALPTKDELGRWVTGMTVVFAGAAATKSGLSDHWVAAALAWLLLLSCVLLYLTIRANVYALIRRRKRGDVARQ